MKEEKCSWPLCHLCHSVLLYDAWVKANMIFEREKVMLDFYEKQLIMSSNGSHPLQNRGGIVKRYLLFSFIAYEELGGWDDFVGAFDSMEEAEAFPINKKLCWQIVDLEKMEVVKQGNN